MEREREQVRREIEETKEAMAEKLEEITDRVDEARDKLRGARDKLSLRYLRSQMREHPWITVGTSVVAGYALYRIVHAGATERAMVKALRGVRGTARGVAEGAKSSAYMARKAARKAGKGSRTMRSIFGGFLARSAVDAITRAAVTTGGGMLLGAVFQRLSSRGESREKGEGHEVIYEQKSSAPTAASVRSGPIMG